MAEYAVIRVGNKQHRVRDGETLVVERVATDEGKTFTPEVLLGGSKVTATVVGH
ncbi:MAG: bL21 family ribosomal protein, partial [Actinobacteria bacterium]|nr:bL21 family ribosomal protein [Actinomycetota bacterium]